MKDTKLKKYLIEIANKLTSESTLEDVYVQLSLLSDIDQSESDEKVGHVFSQAEVVAQAKQWLK